MDSSECRQVNTPFASGQVARSRTARGIRTEKVSPMQSAPTTW